MKKELILWLKLNALVIGLVILTILIGFGIPILIVGSLLR